MVFNIKANPTFKAPVEIRTSSGDRLILTVTFRHKTRTGLKEYLAGLDARSSEDAILEIVEGWEGPDAAFSREALSELLNEHVPAGQALLGVYLQTLTQGAAESVSEILTRNVPRRVAEQLSERD